MSVSLEGVCRSLACPSVFTVSVILLAVYNRSDGWHISVSQFEDIGQSLGCPSISTVSLFPSDAYRLTGVCQSPRWLSTYQMPIEYPYVRLHRLKKDVPVTHESADWERAGMYPQGREAVCQSSLHPHPLGGSTVPYIPPSPGSGCTTCDYTTRNSCNTVSVIGCYWLNIIRVTLCHMVAGKSAQQETTGNISRTMFKFPFPWFFKDFLWDHCINVNVNTKYVKVTYGPVSCWCIWAAHRNDFATHGQ